LPSAKPATALHGEPASEVDRLASTINRLNNRNNAGLQISAVRAEIINSGECSAEGHSARGRTAS